MESLVIGLVPASESKSNSSDLNDATFLENPIQIKQGARASDQSTNNVMIDNSLIYSIDKIKTKDGIEIKPKKSELA